MAASGMERPERSDASPGGPLAEYAAHEAEGRFRIQLCAACGNHAFPPRRVCPHCHEDALGFVPASGRGTVHAVTVIARRAERGGDYNVVLVELEEGVRLMSRVDGIPPGDVRIGLSVVAGFVAAADGPLLTFRPVGA